jgi:exodeoxyribonuclease VII small subunit
VPDDTRKLPSTEAELPFEDALKKLESVVEAMESGDLPLEALLQRFEEGTRLLKQCQARLDQAEIKIQKLEKNAAGQTTLKPLDKMAALVNE